MLLIAIGWSICSTEAFIPTKFYRSGSILLHIIHERLRLPLVTHWDMIRNAILEVAAEVLKDNPNPSDSHSSQRLTLPSSPDEGSLIIAYYGSSDDNWIYRKV